MGARVELEELAMKALVYKIAEGHTIDDLTEEACPGLSLDRCAGAPPSASCTP